MDSPACGARSPRPRSGESWPAGPTIPLHSRASSQDSVMSLNDPNWGRGGGNRPGGGNQGPPDLDELWRNFNRKLNELFGRRRPGSEPPSRGSGPSNARIGGGAGLIALIVLAVWLASGFYIPGQGQSGVGLPPRRVFR